MAYYQIGALTPENIRTTAINDLFCQIFEEPFFNEMRTKEQLGYIVSGGHRKMLDTYGKPEILSMCVSVGG